MMQEAIATEAYRQLKADLTAAGFEVVPEDQVKANVSYKEILKGSGTPNHTRFGNALGDAMLVSPPSLLPYMPYAMEGSRFEQPTSHIGWVSAMGGKSITPGGPSMTSIQSNWKQPGLEVQMAKDLNAHVVKAFYVVTIGTASATRSRELTPGSTITRTGNGSALAEVGLLADQTRIAFRSPNGNAKWQKVAVTKPAPAKDGDVVIRLADPMSGRSDLFSVTSSGSQGGLLRPGADFQFSFVATLTDNAGYQKDVQGMIAAADQSMVALVKR